jgi:hypothetical protein
MYRALLRFGRIIVGAALASLLTAAIANVGTLPIPDPAVLAVLTAALVALDKYLRDSGVY